MLASHGGPYPEAHATGSRAQELRFVEGGQVPGIQGGSGQVGFGNLTRPFPFAAVISALP